MAAVANVQVNVDARGANKKLDELGNKAKRTETAFGKLSSTVGKLAGALALVQTAKFVFAKTAELEKQARSLQVLTGSVAKATTIIRELQEIGKVTPFTSAELIESAKRLNAFGVETEKVVETTTRLADVSGASGAELSGLVTAYGQVIAKGRLQGEELLQFQERGVALQGELRRMYQLSGDEFQEALKKGQIGAESVEVAIKNLTSAGGKYANGAISQSDTLFGKLSTLNDEIGRLARNIGNVLSPVIKGIFDQAIQALEVVNRLLAAGRGGGFARAVGGVAVSITGGATSEAIDRAESLLKQISSQKNRAGIQQNLQALDQLSRQLTRIRPDDVNAAQAMKLQGKIMQLQAENQTALGNLPGKPTALQTKVPELLGATGGGGSGSGSKTANDLQQRIEAGASIEQQLTREIELRSASTELDRELLKINYELEDTLARINETAAEGQKAMLANLAQMNAEQQNAEAIQGSFAAYLKERQQEYKLLSDAQKEFSEFFKKEAEQVNYLNEALRGTGEILGNTLMSTFDALINKTADFNSILADTLKQIGMMLIKSGLNSLAGMGDPTGQSVGILSFLGFGKANGGAVNPNGTYLVGERGPEILTMGNQGGYVHSNTSEAMERYRSGGQNGAGGSLNVNYNVTSINGMNFVTEEQFRIGMDKAAKDGAKMGEAGTFKSMRNSRSSRSRVGL